MKLGRSLVIKEKEIAFHLGWSNFLTKKRERLNKLFFKIIFA